MNQKMEMELIWNRYIPIRPTPTQLALLLTNALEAMYGGAGGGGKSTALLAAALQYVHLAGYNALILRKTYADLNLPGGLLTVAREWLAATDARWQEQRKTWLFPSGSGITFGYLDGPMDKYRYASSEFQFIGIDECTQISESDFRFLFSRLRKKAGSDIPLRMRLASNPGGRGHDWVKQRFIDSKERGRVFIPAKLTDNPHIDQKSYLQSLSQLDAISRARILAGDWTVRDEGGLFKREWFEIVESIPAENMQLVRYWDLASKEAKPNTDSDYTCGLLLGLCGGVYFVCDVRRSRMTPKNVEKLIVQTALLDGRSVEIWMETQRGAAGIALNDHYSKEVLVGYPVRFQRPTGDKVVRANPISSAAEAGNVKLLRADWNRDFLDEIEAFPQGSHDDQVDAFSGAFSVVAKAHSLAMFVENFKQQEIPHGAKRPFQQPRMNAGGSQVIHTERGLQRINNTRRSGLSNVDMRIGGFGRRGR